MSEDGQDLKTETIAIADLRSHPRNYRGHPDDQVEHLKESIRRHGIYRNIVVARDGTILAGHGVVLAARRMGYTQVPAVRLDVGPNDLAALKVLAGDNEIAHLSEIDDRLLSEILKEVKDSDVAGLLGTGYDEKMLANLVFVTRPESEIADFNEAAEWAGMPGYEEGQDPLKVIVSFRNEGDREAFVKHVNVAVLTRKGSVWSAWWPPKEREDAASLRFKG